MTAGIVFRRSGTAHVCFKKRISFIGCVVQHLLHPPPSYIEVQFSRYTLPRGDDIYSRLLLPHSSTPVTQPQLQQLRVGGGGRFWTKMCESERSNFELQCLPVDLVRICDQILHFPPLLRIS